MKRLTSTVLIALGLLMPACDGFPSWQEEIDRCVGIMGKESSGLCFEVAGLLIYLECRRPAYREVMAMAVAGATFDSAIKSVQNEGLCPVQS